MRPVESRNSATCFLSEGFEYFFTRIKPDLRLVSAAVASEQASFAAHVFALAARLGGEAAPRNLVEDLRQTHVATWEHILDSVYRVNKVAAVTDHHLQNKVFEVTSQAVRWRRDAPPCGYNVPAMIVEVRPQERGFKVSVVGRPDMVRKRLPILGLNKEHMVEVPMPEAETIAA